MGTVILSLPYFDMRSTNANIIDTINDIFHDKFGSVVDKIIKVTKKNTKKLALVLRDFFSKSQAIPARESAIVTINIDGKKTLLLI